MSDGKNKPTISARIIKASESNETIKKAEQSTVITDNNALLWINPSVELNGLKEMVDHSTILPQCIRAYKDNIAGFGIEVKYRDDVQQTKEMAEEYTKVKEIIDLLNIDMDTKEVFEDLIEARETYGISYLEVIRNLENEVSEIEFIKDIPSIKKTSPLEPPVAIEYFYKGKSIKRSRKFCKYKQEKNGKIVFFKEFGDTRIMDNRNGKYVDELDLQYQANEVLEFSIGTSDYGTVRWIGQVLSVDGSRKAENLNYNYFKNGRHTPLAVIVSGGTLSEDSFSRLQEYIDNIKGEAGQHAFLLLEVEDSDNKVDFEQDKKPTVELKDMASILQKDELFQEYLNNNRKKAQSSFRLPDLYTGYTTDFNRATAQNAMEVTEKQVFIPERKSLAWVINNKLLNGYQLKYVEVYFKAPDITNPDDVFRILNITERAGGLTPNTAKEITGDTIGKSVEPYDEEWGDTPLVVSKLQATSATPQQTVTEQIDQAIQKAVSTKDDDVVTIMKEVKRLILER